MADSSEINNNFERLQQYAISALQREISSLPPGLFQNSPIVQNLKNIVQTIENFSGSEDVSWRNSPGIDLSPVSTCLSSRKILLNIWKHTTNADLLHFRRLNRQWYRLATMVLLKRGAFHVRLYYSERSESYLVNSSSSDLYLEMLNDCLKNTQRFPAAEVRIQGGKLNEPDLLSFLGLIGLKIKSLVLRQSATAINLSDLFNLVPNVENLNLVDFGPSNRLCSYEENSDTIDFFPPDLTLVKVPSLKHLILEQLDKVPGNFELLLAIAGSTKHLLSISLTQMKFLFCFSDYARLVKNITFDSHHDIQLCNSFAKLEPKLRAFTIDLSDFRNKVKSICQAAPHLESILVSSKDSLEELTFIRAGLFPAHFPVFSRLKKLSIFEHMSDIRERVLPEVISYLPLFPFLKTVVIGVELHHREMRILFPEDDFRNNDVESFPTVENLIFFNQSECASISEILFLKFPNVTHVKIGPGNLSKSDHMLWVIPNTVENLELSNESFEILEDGMFISLDSLLTGISINKCVELENISGIVGVEADSLRSEPWIGALKNLKHLKISFTRNLGLTTRFLTLVSFLYGFNLMPNLDVTFAYDFKVKEAESFRILYGPMLPYVNVEHERSDIGLF